MTTNLPISWNQKELKDVAIIERKNVKPENISGDTIFIGLEHMTSVGGFTNIETVQAGEIASNKFSFNSSHILYGKLRPYLRKITRPEFSGICSTDILPILPCSEMDRDYLYHYLRQQEYVDLATTRSSGANLPRISPKTLETFPISFPPLEEQKRIAAILDKADRVRRKRQEAIRLTEELGRSIFLDMFGDLFAFLTGKQKHDKGFLYCKLGEQITLQRGFDLLKKDCIEGIYPVISSGGIHTYHDQYKAKGPGVLLGRKGSVGRVHYIEDNYWPHDTTLWIKDFNNNNPVFVYHFFRLFPILRFEASTASPTLNRNRLHPLQVFWPDKELQIKFANSISVINKYDHKNGFYFSQSENLFNSLLQRAFRGEL
jgi:type I restriction enzyme, S subunit